MHSISICTYNILAQCHISHNIRNGINPIFCSEPSRRARLSSFLRQQSSLIIALQEVEDTFFPEITSIYPNHICKYARRPNKTEGLVIAIHQSCLIIDTKDLVLYSENGEPRRIAQVIKCLFQGLSFRIIHVHLDFDRPPKRDGFLQIQSILETSFEKSLPTIILGDCNVEEEGDAFSYITSKGFSFAPTHAPTCFHNESWSRVDHIFYQQPFAISQLEIPSAERIPNKEWGSDHLPISCHFTFS